MIKFNMYNITDTSTGIKARVHYNHGVDIHGNMRVWIYEKDYARNLLKLFPTAKNESDGTIDYFESTRLSFYPGDKHYNEVMTIIKKLEAKTMARRQKQMD